MGNIFELLIYQLENISDKQLYDKLSLYYVPDDDS